MEASGQLQNERALMDGPEEGTSRDAMLIQPTVEGTCSIRSPAPEFLAHMRQRVAAGLLSGKPHRRSNYVTSQGGPAQLHIRAADWWTAINVGLNEFELHAPEPGLVHYHVRYWRWAGFAVGGGAGPGVVGIALLLLADPRSYIAEHAAQMVPGLSVEQNLLVPSPELFHERALSAGATELSALALRDWGHLASYCLDPDGHVIAFATDDG